MKELKYIKPSCIATKFMEGCRSIRQRVRCEICLEKFLMVFQRELTAGLVGNWNRV